VPLQNRVTPTGEIVCDPGRGLLMGNRGCLHGPDRRLGAARWRSKLWICCVLAWKAVRRDPMPPGRWTALFFLDEATALAAGHRPCAYCRRADFVAFAEGWRAAHGLAEGSGEPQGGAPVDRSEGSGEPQGGAPVDRSEGSGEPQGGAPVDRSEGSGEPQGGAPVDPGRPRASQIDARLHAERVDPRSRRQLTRPAVVGELPDGVMIRHGGTPGLLAGRGMLPWSFAGYQAPIALPPTTPVELLTPPATVATIAAGYRPLVHPSAAAVHALRVLRR
jgi:hypothetical protein